MTETSSLNILCVGAHRSPSNAWRRVLTLRRMGHKVDTLDTSGRIFFRSSNVTRVVNRLGGGYLRERLADELECMIKKNPPDILFVEKGTWLRSQRLENIRRLAPASLKIAHYNPDDPFGAYREGWEIFKQAIPGYDIHFVPKQLNVQEYQALGAKQVVVFDRAYDPTLHRPLELTDTEKQKYACDIGFIGTWAPQREEMLAALVKDGLPLALWGNGWHNGKHWSLLRKYHRGPGQYDEDYVKCINGMKIALHFLRHENRDQQDSRTFEIPACRVFMLAEWSPDHARLFRENVDSVFFKNSSEMREKAKYYLNYTSDRCTIASVGHSSIINGKNTHKDRLELFLKTIMQDSNAS